MCGGDGLLHAPGLQAVSRQLSYSSPVCMFVQVLPGWDSVDRAAGGIGDLLRCRPGVHEHYLYIRLH